MDCKSISYYLHLCMRFITVLIALHLLISSLLSNSEFAGMMRMGNLVSHFFHHIQEHDQDISILEFLAMHYFDQEHLQHDKYEDQELPVKNHNTQSFNACYIPIANVLVSADFSGFSVNEDCNYGIYHEQIFKTPLIDIWQPPKLS